MLLRLALTVLAHVMPSSAYSVIEDLASYDHVNQVDQFSNQQTHVQRILAISSSTTSIVFCLVSFYLFFAIDPRRLVFRHQLVFFLLFFDFMKAIVLLLYPSRVLTSYKSYFNFRFCQVVGFFTATAIEGADLAILAFALHTYLLIFRPSLNVKVGDPKRVEGGLYRIRWLVYPLCFIIPLVLASLAFIRSSGYDSFVCWCYLPQRPVWYRLVLSWVPRWCILVTIFAVYGLIYYHVIKEYRVVGGVLTTIHRAKLAHTLQNEKPSFFSALHYFYLSIKDALTSKLLILDSETLEPAQSNVTRKQTLQSPRSAHNGDMSPTNNRSESTDTRVNDSEHDDDMSSSDNDLEPFEGVQRPMSPHPAGSGSSQHIPSQDLHLENLKAFKRRQRVIKKQMKSIFVYPLAYVFIWLFPFILYVTQINYELEHGPVYWLNCMGAFMQPFNGFVDSLVFFYRETPWKYTVMNKFKRDHSNIMDQIMTAKRFSKNSMDSPEKTANHSLSSSFAVDLSRFCWWRRVLNYLRFPLFQLPTEENLAKLQEQYLRKKLHHHDNPDSNSSHVNMLETGNTHGHDFSDILGGSFAENEFRTTLESFTLNFSNRNSTVSAHQSPRISRANSDQTHTQKRKGSIRSTRSRQFSVIDPNSAVIFEGKPLDSGSNANDAPPGTAKRHSVGSSNTLAVSRRRDNSGSSTPRKVSKATIENRSSTSQREDSNSEMDFLEFLKKGPS